MSTNGAKDVQFFVNEKAGAVSGLLIKPSDARGLLLLAHEARFPLPQYSSRVWPGNGLYGFLSELDRVDPARRDFLEDF